MDLIRFLNSSKKRLNYLAAKDLDFEDDENKDLLFNRCRYQFNNAIEYFEVNFLSDILSMQFRSAIDVRQESDKEKASQDI